MYDNKTYIRDAGSGGILNTDHSGLEAYKKRRKHLNEQQSTISSLTNDVNAIKDEMKSIKEMLVKILDK